MQDLDPDIMDIFSMDQSHSADEAGMKSGVSELVPNMIIDHFLFEPHGYSMNGILPNGQYITVHVTPEPHCSYVSFETNVAKESYRDLITKVIKLFRPGKFLLTVFANKNSLAKNFYKELSRLDCFESYRRCDHEYCQFKNYNLTYTSYTRPTPFPPH
ncbi:S-adenosylmethionine decarboxylase proenzyme [Lamellibrachia satsuma]|nr:S-adenosylmethionine decarboxylase proenzyme [Lamellibrachia satsuma]